MRSQALLRAWQRRGLLAVALSPLGVMFRLLVALRRLAYGWGLLRSRGVPCAVVVVGNVVLGGAGKTPTTIAIVQYLQGRALRVGVVSRGYGRTDSAVRAVASSDDASAVGDEPLLIARATGAPVWVGRDRHAAAQALLAAHPQVQVLVCDDGLQHLHLQRDVEVCVFDNRGIGNGWLLPAGPLREPWPGQYRLSSAKNDTPQLLVLHTGTHPAFAGFRATRSLAPVAHSGTHRHVRLNALPGPVLAVAGIAQPQTFFWALEAAGVRVEKTLALPDHHSFEDLDVRQFQGFDVVCTEKDAVKLWQRWPAAWAVPLVQTLEPAFLQALDSRVDAAISTKLSSPHGHQTA
ncbi:MAG: tetraacyldisaccharide 4'-kinase [Rhodoferax sp.]|nr:tetraacyldisaccharide 4'-kinase [Rhodoferax sp.]